VNRSLFQRKRPTVGRSRRDLGRGIEPEQQPAGFVAVQDHLEEPRVAVLVPNRALGLSRPVGAIDGRHLRGLLRPLPGFPGFPLNVVELFQLQIAGSIEVANGRFPPSSADGPQVLADRGLLDS
jgi:hypothetical protein